MPYKIFPIRLGGILKGYKVGKADGTLMSNGKRFTSKNPMPRSQAVKQIIAIEKNERKK